MKLIKHDEPKKEEQLNGMTIMQLDEDRFIPVRNRNPIHIGTYNGYQVYTTTDTGYITGYYRVLNETN